jgi:hypothetical protein
MTNDDYFVKERMARGTRQVDNRGRSAFLDIAEGLGLGGAAPGQDQDRGREFELTRAFRVELADQQKGGSR